MAHEILIVDDEPDIRMLIDGILGDEGYGVRQAGDSDGAIAAFRLRRPSLVILDVWLPGLAAGRAGDPQDHPYGGAARSRGHDLRPRHDRDGGDGDPAWRVRFHREAVQVGPFAADHPPGTRGGAAGAGECGAAPSRGLRQRPHGQQPGHHHPARRRGAGGAHRLPRADQRSRGLRQGSGGADGARALPPGGRAVRGAELARLSTRPASRRSCSAWKPGRTPWPRHAGQGCWNARMAARCCWTKYPTCRWKRRVRSSARYRIKRSSGWAARPA